MSAAPLTAAAPLVFLHIPKTAGQSVHAALSGAAGAGCVSPVRVHAEAPRGAAQMPAGYSLYSGHIDWEALEALPPARRVFTVLRDPLERMASFYFYLRREAGKLSPAALARPERTGMRRAAGLSAEVYFFGGDPGWRRFVRDHYQNPYCSYLATRRIRGRGDLPPLPARALLARAEAAARALDGVYDVSELARLEADLTRWTGLRLSIAARRVNAGPGAGARWPALAAELGPVAAARLTRWVALDRALMVRLGLGADRFVSGAASMSAPVSTVAAGDGV